MTLPTVERKLRAIEASDEAALLDAIDRWLDKEVKPQVM
jgi:hypothetical protein